MKSNIYKSGLAALLAGLTLTGCDPEIDAPKVDKGQANFSKYIAVGNSLTAGYMDNGLYLEGQLNSYPAILAQQFKLAGGGAFEQPLFSENERNGSGYIMLAGFSPTGLPDIRQVTNNTAVQPNGRFSHYNGTVNNLGVPDIRVADVKTPGYGSSGGNRYFERIADSPSQTYLQKIQASTDHTFFTNWLGNNDVLAYATSGGFLYPITNSQTFTENYTEVLNALTSNGAKGLVATIPEVNAVPFFNTVGPTVKQVLVASSAPGMIAMTGDQNSKARILIPTTTIKGADGGTVLFPLTAAPYAPLINQRTGKFWRDAYKQLNPGGPAIGLSLLLANYQIDTTKTFGTSTENPWPSLLLLDNTELALIKTNTDFFNSHIKVEAAARGLAVFDSNIYFNSIQGGFTKHIVTYSPVFISGNLFSLDGVHPTPRGYAFVASEMIKAINSQYGSTLPTVDETQYRDVLFPN